MTYAHVPPRSAFNNRKLISSDMYPWDAAAWFSPDTKPVGRQMQRGFGVYSLCGSCNSFLGSKYEPSYAAFVRTLWDLQLTKSSRLLLPFRIRPLCLIKAIIGMFVTINANAPVFRKRVGNFLFDTQSTALPPEYRVFIFSATGKRFRAQDVCAQIGKHSTSVFSEIATYPMGLVLSLDGSVPDDRLLEITQFRSARYEYEGTDYLRMPHFRLDSPMSLDFRSWEEIEQRGPELDVRGTAKKADTPLDNV